MPITPLHALSVLWLNYKKGKFFDPLALIVSSVIIDLEPFFVLTFDLPYLSHGFWHSYFAAFILSFSLTPILYGVELKMKGVLSKVFKFFGLKCYVLPYELKSILLSCLVGAGLHIFFDSFTHAKFPYVLFPFYVSSGYSNPFWFGFNSAIIVEFTVVGLSLFSCILWLKSYSSVSKV
jgi:hypothetical protein